MLAFQIQLLHLAIVGLASSGITYGFSMGPVGDLHIVNKDIAPDGFQRPTVLAGGTFPGTLITAQKGDTFAINVIDELSDGRMNKTTSIHWHGLFQRGTNWADGANGVNQCPIASGHSFVYRFQAYEQAGTYWYHSHLGTQYCDGLRGPIVVYDPNDPMKNMYDVDDENTVITVGDWYHSVSSQQPKPAVLDSTVINGLGRYPTGNLSSPLAVINVEQGKRYRMRLVSISCDPNFQFSIDGHDMTVIEADGITHQPVVVNSLQIFAGQRYSFIAGVRALPNGNAALQTFDNGINSAILRYVGASTEEPTTSPAVTTIPLAETDLKPLVNPQAPGSPSVDAPDVFKITLKLGRTSPVGNFTINDISFRPPSVPVLLQILSGARAAQDLAPYGAVQTLPPNTVIQIALPARNETGTDVVAASPHPFHLHGHAFSVIRSAGSSTYNFVDPPRRDVVNIGSSVNDNVTVRFTTDNPGPWFLHCHIDWHLAAGFAMVFAEDPQDTAAANSPIPEEWSDLCNIYDALAPGDY